MTMLFMDSFDHYGLDDTKMKDGAWADAGSAYRSVLENPGFGARTGNNCLILYGGDGNARLVLPSAQTDFHVGFGIYAPALPGTNRPFLRFANESNATLAVMILLTTGALVLSSTEDIGNQIVATQGPAITAGTWHHLEMRYTGGDGTGAFELRLDGSTSPIIDGSTLGMSGQDVSQIEFYYDNSFISSNWIHIDDLVVYDRNGDYNNDFLGDVRVATLVPDSDDELNWTPRYRSHLDGNGILDLSDVGTEDDDAMVSAADSGDFEFGTGDYTVEGFVRFLGTSQDDRQIIGKWQTNLNRREWRLELTGDNNVNPNQLRFLVSTDGSSTTVIHTWPFVPLLYKWYHFAVVRDGTDSYLFLDGEMLGTVRTDANDYHADQAALAIGAQMSSDTAVVANSGINGMMDEVRITKGVARYTSEFTPTTTKFGRDVGADTDFASVTLLAGFDDQTIEDESDSGHTLTARNSAQAILPDDGEGGYTAINQLDPRDDTVIEALLAPAIGILTLTANPSDTETVTIEGQAYEFVNSLSSAFDVLIGANIGESLDNLMAAINAGSGEGSVYGTGTTANTDVEASRLPDPQLMVTALTPGNGGNSIDTTETLANGSWGAATLEGGVSIPDASKFGMSRLPSQTTQVKAIQVVTRAHKTDSGAATIQTTLVGPLGATEAGSSKTLSVDPTYRWDIFEEDPDTEAGLTPATIMNGLIQIDRDS